MIGNRLFGLVKNHAAALLGGLTIALFLAALFLAFVVSPIDEAMGPIQKIFYLHVPSAYGMYLGAVTAAAASLWYLLGRSETADAVASAAVDAGIAFFVVVMVTGPIWARQAWGVFWTWEPRLTTTFILGLVFVLYRAVRRAGGNGRGERRFAAVLAILGAINVPLVHYALVLWRGQHPQVLYGRGGGLAPVMLLTLGAWIGAMTSLFGLLLLLQYRLKRPAGVRGSPEAGS